MRSGAYSCSRDLNHPRRRDSDPSHEYAVCSVNIADVYVEDTLLGVEWDRYTRPEVLGAAAGISLAVIVMILNALI